MNNRPTPDDASDTRDGSKAAEDAAKAAEYAPPPMRGAKAAEDAGDAAEDAGDAAKAAGDAAEDAGDAAREAAKAAAYVPPPMRGVRFENVAPEDDLSPAEIDALFAAQEARAPPRAAPAVGSTAVMEESDMDALLNSIGEGPESYAWLPNWAASPSPPGGPGPPRAGDAEEALQIVRDLETALATVDDTTVATRDGVTDLRDDVRLLQDQVEGIDSGIATIKAQNAGLVEEVRELRHTVMTLRTLVAALVRVLSFDGSEAESAGPA